MKKLFKLIILLRGAAQLLGRGRARHAYYPLERHHRPSLAERLLRRFTSRAGG